MEESLSSVGTTNGVDWLVFGAGDVAIPVAPPGNIIWIIATDQSTKPQTTKDTRGNRPVTKGISKPIALIPPPSTPTKIKMAPNTNRTPSFV